MTSRSHEIKKSIETADLNDYAKDKKLCLKVKPQIWETRRAGHR
jgi:hypothetical protein